MAERLISPEKIFKEAEKIHTETLPPDKETEKQELNKRLSQPCFVDLTDKHFNTENHEKQENSIAIFRALITNPNDIRTITQFEQQRNAFRRYSDASHIRNEWHIITDLQYQLNGHEINITDLLPPDYKILSKNDNDELTAVIAKEFKAIIFVGEIQSLGALIVILHEIGHSKYGELTNSPNISKSKNKNDKENAETLLEERESSMFALRKIWPAIRNNTKIKNDVLSFLKYSYASYWPNIIRSRAHYDAFPWFRYKAWQKFKKSAEYPIWKNLPENKELTASQEFPQWDEWVESTKQEDNPSFIAKFYEEDTQ